MGCSQEAHRTLSEKPRHGGRGKCCRGGNSYDVTQTLRPTAGEKRPERIEFDRASRCVRRNGAVECDFQRPRFASTREGLSGGVKPHKFGGKNWRQNLAAMSAGVSDNNQRPVLAVNRAFGTRRSTSGRRPKQPLTPHDAAGRYGCYTGRWEETHAEQPCHPSGWPAPLTETETTNCWTQKKHPR